MQWLQAGQGESGEVVGQPMYVAMVDLTCDVDFLELAKSGLLAALEAIPPASLFGLTTFSRRVSHSQVPEPQWTERCTSRWPCTHLVAAVQVTAGNVMHALLHCKPGLGCWP